MIPAHQTSARKSYKSYHLFVSANYSFSNILHPKHEMCLCFLLIFSIFPTFCHYFCVVLKPKINYKIHYGINLFSFNISYQVIFPLVFASATVFTTLHHHGEHFLINIYFIKNLFFKFLVDMHLPSKI